MYPFTTIIPFILLETENFLASFVSNLCWKAWMSWPISRSLFRPHPYY